MAKTSGTNNEFELVVPVKILVRPGFSADGIETAASSLRKRSITQDEVPSESHGSNSGETGNVFLISGSVSNKIKGLKKEASVEIEENPVIKNAAYYVEHCFRLMYLTGMSTFDPDKKEHDEKSWMDTICHGLQMIAYWVVTLISIAFAVIYLKQNWIRFLSDKGVPNIVRVGSWLFTIVSEIYYIIFFAFGHQRIKKAMTALRTVESHSSHSIDEVGTKKRKCRNPRKMITILFIVSIFACFMQPMGGHGVKGWSPKKLILDSSTKLAFMIFIWNPDDVTGNATKLDMLVQEYGTELSPLTVSMGLTDITMRFSSKLKMDTALNIGIVVAILTFLRNRHFSRKVKIVGSRNIGSNESLRLSSCHGLFAEFKQVLKKENKILNALVGGLLKIIHAYNLMQCAAFFMRTLDTEATLTEFVFLAYNLIKVAIMYYFGKKAEAENDLYEKWIIDWAMQSEDPLFLARAPVILHEMAKEPMGLGRGKFLVGQGFIFRFLGFVGSVFMLEVDKDDSDDDDD